jgi:orotate phosphoribosyltransferase
LTISDYKCLENKELNNSLFSKLKLKEYIQRKTMKDTITLLRESEAMLEGHFLLSSGKHSDRYFQCARLLQYPDKAAEALATAAARIKKDIADGKLQIDAVCGPAMGGIIVAYELARQLGLPAIFTERDDTGKMTLRRGFTIRPGEKILIAEDVITTGKSSGEAATALENLGAEVVALACIVDRRSSDESLKWPLYECAKIEALTWNAESCTLCEEGIPAVKPGTRKM